MFRTIVNAFKIKDVRKRLLYTILMLVVIRLGSQLPVPGVNRSYFADWFAQRGVAFYNFNGMDLYALTDHSVERFTDLDGHMNGDAARAFSAVLGEVLEA